MAERLISVHCQICGRPTGEVFPESKVNNLDNEQRTCDRCINYPARPEHEPENATPTHTITFDVNALGGGINAQPATEIFHCVSCGSDEFYGYQNLQRMVNAEIRTVNGRLEAFYIIDYDADFNEGDIDPTYYCSTCDTEVTVLRSRHQ